MMEAFESETELLFYNLNGRVHLLFRINGRYPIINLYFCHIPFSASNKEKNHRKAKRCSHIFFMIKPSINSNIISKRQIFPRLAKNHL